MIAYEHSLFLANERAVRADLEQKGMEFIEVDKTAFADRCRQAIYESLSPEMQEQYNTFLNSLP